MRCNQYSAVGIWRSLGLVKGKTGKRNWLTWYYSLCPLFYWQNFQVPTPANSAFVEPCYCGCDIFYFTSSNYPVFAFLTIENVAVVLFFFCQYDVLYRENPFRCHQVQGISSSPSYRGSSCMTTHIWWQRELLLLLNLEKNGQASIRIFQ